MRGLLCGIRAVFRSKSRFVARPAKCKLLHVSVVDNNRYRNSHFDQKGDPPFECEELWGSGW